MNDNGSSPAPSPVDLTGPVFISYRQSDGTDITAELAWMLRAAGIPVWRDRDDLPPGDTEARLEQAIADGLSGAILVATPDVEKSEIVRFIEAPRLIDLHRGHPAFALGIANAIERVPGKLDYDAPDLVLAQRPKTLSGVDQHPSDRAGLRLLVQKMLWHRIAWQRDAIAAAGETFHPSVQTRNAPQVYDRTGHQLDIRIRPSLHDKLPSADGLRDLKDTLGLLPDAITRAGASTVRVHGGAHLSVAFALGAAMPSSRVGEIQVIDQRQQTWASSHEAKMGIPPLLLVNAEGTNPAPTTTGRPSVAVYLDLLPQRSDNAFARYREENQHAVTAWEHLVYASDDLLDPTAAGEIAAEAAARIRTLSNIHGNAEVHLLLRCPFPIAVLLGRLLNTLRFVTYEWDDSDAPSGDDYRARYVPSVRVRPSAVGGAIEEVLLVDGSDAP